MPWYAGALLKKTAEDDDRQAETGRLSNPEKIIYGAGLLGGGGLGWLLSAAIHGKRIPLYKRLMYAAAGATAGGLGAHAYLQSNSGLKDKNNKPLTNSELYRLDAKGNLYKRKGDDSRLYTESQKANEISKAAIPESDLERYVGLGAGASAAGLTYMAADMAMSSAAHKAISDAIGPEITIGDHTYTFNRKLYDANTALDKAYNEASKVGPKGTPVPVVERAAAIMNEAHKANPKSTPAAAVSLDELNKTRTKGYRLDMSAAKADDPNAKPSMRSHTFTQKGGRLGAATRTASKAGGSFVSGLSGYYAGKWLFPGDEGRPRLTEDDFVLVPPRD